MQKITEEMLVKAARNAKHVKVKALDLRGLIFVAQSQSRADVEYRIRLRRAANGDRYGECTCVGFERKGYCKHLFGAVALVLAIKAARQRANEPAAQPASPTVAAACEKAIGSEAPVPSRSLTEEMAAAVLIKPQHREVQHLGGI